MRIINKNVLLCILALCLISAPASVLAEGTKLDVRTSTANDGSIIAEVVLDGTLTVSGLQFALDYDASRLQLSKLEDGDLKSSLVNDTEPGKLALVWYSVDGVPVSGESSVIKLTFTPKADGEAKISFNTSDMDTMVVNSNLVTVDTQTQNATVNIGSTGNTTISSDTPPYITAPASPTPVYLPPATPVISTKTMPPEERAVSTPSPTPDTASDASTGAKLPTSPGQTQEIEDPTIQTSIIPTVDYYPPQLVNTPNVSVQPEEAPKIEIVDMVDKGGSSIWLWGIGAIILIASGCLIYLKIGKKN